MATDILPLLADRVRGLLAIKNRQQNELNGIEANLLAKWLGGFKKMGLADLKALAEALEVTTDYLVGLGDDYRVGGKRDNYAFAAANADTCAQNITTSAAMLFRPAVIPVCAFP